MELMRLAAVLSLDDSSFKKGVDSAENKGQQLAGKLKASTVAAGQIIANYAMKGIDAINGVINGAVSGYGRYEQLIGGVETLFKSSADKVSKYAKQSFRTTGLSANDYMETVTSFSASLLQGLGGDTEKAAELANMAVTDMADNANKMGTDISTIQSAYQGFAKQNYTMLDNLKLGYGGTQSEMVRLINDSGILDHKIKNLNGITFDQMIEAIHKVQTEMGITGTTAEEAAKTLEGSKAAMQAAWEDLLSSVGGAGNLDQTKENFISSFKTYIVDNLAPAVQSTLENAPELISAVTEAIKTIPSKAITDLAGSGIDLLTATVNGATDLAGWLIDGLVGLFKDINADPSKIAELGNAVGNFIGSALSDIVTNAPTIISGLFTAGVSLAGSLIEGLFSGLFGTDNELDETMQGIEENMQDSINEATANSVKAKGIITYLEDLAAKYGDAAKNTTEFEQAMKELNQYMEVPEWIINSTNSMENLIRTLKSYNHELEKQAIETAKRKALKEKEDALIDAQANLLSAKSDLQIKKNESSAAIDALIAFFQGAKSKETGEDINFGLAPEATADQIAAAVQSAFKDMTGGEGNQAYADNIDYINTLLGVIKENDQPIKTLEASISTLESQVEEARVKYLTSSAAIDDLTGSASGAAQALAAIKTPSITYNGGEWANWFYGGQHKASGMDSVPYNGFKAVLHKGEAVLTRREADQYRNGGSSAAIVSELQAMRNDLTKMKLVVGRKTFGRAVVDYGGDGVNNFIGDAESRQAAGYGT